MLINEGKDLFLTISSFSSSKEKFYDRSSTRLINDRYIPRVFLSQRSPFNDAFNRNERLCIFFHLLSYFRVKKASRLQDIANLAKIHKDTSTYTGLPNLCETSSAVAEVVRHWSRGMERKREQRRRKKAEGQREAKKDRKVYTWREGEGRRIF